MKKQKSRRLLLVLVAVLGAIGLVVVSAAASVLAYRQFAGDAKSELDVIVEGLQVEEDQEAEAQGVVVWHVEPGSPAEQAGLSSGTIILSLNGDPVDSPQQLKEKIAGYDVGDTVTLTIQDGEDKKDIAVTLGDSGPYLGVNVGPAGGAFHFYDGDLGEMPHGFALPGMPGGPRFHGDPDAPEDMTPFEFPFDEFDFDEFGSEHGRFFGFLGESAFVMSVEEGSPAGEAGLLAGDAIVEANGQSVEDSQQLIDLVADLAPGDTLSLQIQRGDETVSFEVTLASHPEDSNRAYLGVFLAPDMVREEMEYFQDRQSS